ncbi:TetR/AcrR family transcriptional regulator [Algiphilus aromaticivorans]|uniref:TetR/AcrR family transcriptional regulator n=1 Tax=Algiphilus aromaticivorans TaxID=382454 RepID=UPI0005C1D7F8|nr:TetR/AcrR family transcriptional regulator [Algiphilus aromaticivorans]
MPRKASTQPSTTLQSIRDHAFTLFGRHGYEGVSIGEIATHARLSKGALYWHFPGKEALYLDCLTRLHAIFNEHIFDRMRAGQDPVSRILSLFNGLGTMLTDPRVQTGVAGYWLTPMRSTSPRLDEAQRAFEATSREVIVETLRDGVAQGHFDLQDDLEDMASAIMALVEAIILPLRHQEHGEVSAMLGVLARTLFRAYANSGDLVERARAI